MWCSYEYCLVNGKIKKEHLYKWKFLRLNKSYREDFDALSEKEGDDFLDYEDVLKSKWRLLKLVSYEQEALCEDVFYVRENGIVELEAMSYGRLYSFDPKGLTEKRNRVMNEVYESGVSFYGNEKKMIKLVLDMDDNINMAEIKDELSKIYNSYKEKVSPVTMNEANLDMLAKVYELFAEHLENLNPSKVKKMLGLSSTSDVNKKFKSASSIVENIKYFLPKFPFK